MLSMHPRYCLRAWRQNFGAGSPGILKILFAAFVLPCSRRRRRRKPPS